LSLGAYLLEHRRVLKHVGQYEKADFAATDEDIFQLGHSSVPVRDRDVGHLAVHVVLRLQQFAPVHFTSVGLACDYMALRLVKNLDRNADGHGS